MSGRPEAAGGWSDLYDDYDPDAWQEFTPWRPGDPSTAGEAPMSARGHYYEDDDELRAFRRTLTRVQVQAASQADSQEILARRLKELT